MLDPTLRFSAARRTGHVNLLECRAASSLDERRNFRSLYEQQHALVRRTVRRFRVAREDVDDVVQEVFIILHMRLSELEDRRALEPWLRATARRVSSNWHRWYRRHKPASECPILEFDGLTAVGVDELAPDERVARAELMHRLSLALEGLHPKKRVVVTLSIFERLTLAQIAARLGAPIYTIASRLRTGYGELVYSLTRRSNGFQNSW